MKSDQHKLATKYLAEVLRHNNYSPVWTEYKGSDVAAWKGKFSLAAEFERSSRNFVRNCKRNFANGFCGSIAACADEKVKEEIIKLMNEHFDETTKDRIGICVLQLKEI